MNPIFLQILAGLALVVAGGFIGSWFTKRQRIQGMPENFAVFQERVERIMAERKRDHDDVAGAVLRLQTDLVGVRESVMWMRGKMGNGTNWKGP